MFGIRQSGSMIFKIGDVFADSACLVEAGKAADHILSEDPELKSEKYAFLGNRITAKVIRKQRAGYLINKELQC